MDAIPDDIREQAKKVLDYLMCPDMPDDSEIDAVAALVVAEREWCAKIADGEAERAQALYDAVKKWDVGQLADHKIEADLYRKLAAAIREPR